MDEFFVPKLSEFNHIFPDPMRSSCEGVVAWGGDLNPNRVINAYKNGIFPWFNKQDPILWWSPNPRCVLYPKDMKISKSLKKSMKKYQVTFDKDFEKVIKMCQEVRIKNNEQTWIFDEIIKTYTILHERDLAHSVEVWDKDELIGGLYGICMGKIFCGESMFSTKSDGSKVALAELAKRLDFYDFGLIDCQVTNSHLLSLGAFEMEKSEFLEKLNSLVNQPSGFSRFSSI